MHRLLTYTKNTVLGLLIVLFFSNVTFAYAIDFHMCQGEFQSLAFFGQKASCSKMLEAEAEEPLSCCDTKKSTEGISFNQKSCCDNEVVSQQNDLDKPSIDFQQTTNFSTDFINDFSPIEVLNQCEIKVVLKEEIPPPPNLYNQHSQENLQVFRI